MKRKQNTKAIDAWQAEHVDRIIIKPRKEEHFSERIQLAIDRGFGKSRQGYIIEAVRRALEADGIEEIGEKKDAEEAEHQGD